jgi:hypothetical protein
MYLLSYPFRLSVICLKYLLFISHAREFLFSRLHILLVCPEPENKSKIKSFSFDEAIIILSINFSGLIVG